MNSQDYKIHIVGGGISGLIAAIVLEKNGFRPVIIEASERVGGRLKTDVINGYQLDHGFQVLLTAYPAAQKYLDFEALELEKFVPGAAIFKTGHQKIIGDPLRDASLLFSTLTAGIGKFSDKLKIMKLNARLKKKSLSDIFLTEEQSTLSYLEELGFSSKIIDEFFTPFFSGIFLESKLNTSSRMFEFVYKMFGEGYASLPQSGIEAIPKQLKQKLKHTKFIFNTKVESISDGEIGLVDKTKLESHFTILAADASHLIPNLKKSSTAWKSCDTLYFETERRFIKRPLIGLIPDQNTLINNIFFHTSIKTHSRGDKELLSVTVVDNQNLSNSDLIEHVKRELLSHCGIEPKAFLKHYSIPLALPELNDLKYEMQPSETKLTSQIFLAGDIQLNGSLNAAMISGERAALGVIQSLS